MGEKVAVIWTGKEQRCGGQTQEAWWVSGDGVKARGGVKKHWLLWLEYPRRECYTDPCLPSSKCELHRLACHRAGRNLMCSLLICQWGAKVWETGEKKFGLDNRTHYQEAWECTVTWNKTWLICCSPSWLTTPWYSGGRQIYSFSDYPSVPEASLLVFRYHPDVPGISHGRQTLHWAVSIQADHLCSSVSRLLLPPPGTMTKTGSMKVKKISESIVYEWTLERMVVL